MILPAFVYPILLVGILLNSHMDSTFQYAIKHVLEVEGGYVNDENDPGGETKYGISKRSYPNVDIKNLTRGEAIEIYRRDYWEPVRQAVSEPRMQILVLDSAINHGKGRALEWLSAYPDFDSYLANRIRFYTNLDTFNIYGRGWMRRVASVVAIANRVEAERQVVDMLIDNRPFYTRILSAIRGKGGATAFRVRPLTSGTGTKLDIDAA